MADNHEHIIIQRGKDKAYAISPIGEGGQFLMDPKVKKHIMEGIAQPKAGKTTAINPEDFDKLLGL